MPRVSRLVLRVTITCMQFIAARHFPVAMLSRSCNYFTKDILAHANKVSTAVAFIIVADTSQEGKFIVLYDDDERIAAGAATVFVQRGVDNVFMLSGGSTIVPADTHHIRRPARTAAEVLPVRHRDG